MARNVASMKVTGIKPLMKRLKMLPARVQRKVLRPAVTKAATPVLKDAKKRTPVGTGIDPDGQERPNLRKTLKKTRAKMAKRSGAVYVVIGPEAGKAPHAMLVHDGTAPHQIVLTKPVLLQNTYLPAGFTIYHPGAGPQPFLADAVDAQAANSLAILKKEIAAGLAKEAAKLRSAT